MAAKAEDLLKSSNVLLYAIGIDDDDNDPLTRRRTRYHIYEYMLNQLTGAAGGRVIRLYTGRNYDLRTFSELFSESYIWGIRLTTIRQPYRLLQCRKTLRSEWKRQALVF